MTRRKFIYRVVKAGSVILVGAAWLAKKAAPRRFVRAVRHDKYPGPLRPPYGIFEQGKWSG